MMVTKELFWVAIITVVWCWLLHQVAMVIAG